MNCFHFYKECSGVRCVVLPRKVAKISQSADDEIPASEASPRVPDLPGHAHPHPWSAPAQRYPSLKMRKILLLTSLPPTFPEILAY